MVNVYLYTYSLQFTIHTRKLYTGIRHPYITSNRNILISFLSRGSSSRAAHLHFFLSPQYTSVSRRKKGEVGISLFFFRCAWYYSVERCLHDSYILFLQLNTREPGSFFFSSSTRRKNKQKRQAPSQCLRNREKECVFECMMMMR